MSDQTRNKINRHLTVLADILTGTVKELLSIPKFGGATVASHVLEGKPRRRSYRKAATRSYSRQPRAPRAYLPQYHQTQRPQLVIINNYNY